MMFSIWSDCVIDDRYDTLEGYNIQIYDNYHQK